PLSPLLASVSRFRLHAPAPSAFYTLSLHDALPICSFSVSFLRPHRPAGPPHTWYRQAVHASFSSFLAGLLSGAFHLPDKHMHCQDRKSTRLNSSHVSISYAVFCLKKKKTREQRIGR